jgi:phage shock protein PspC (stress-responsive transcriptional regulator)
MAKQLHLSRRDKKLAGVCGGLAEYLEVDSTLIRIIWVALTLLGGSGLLLYIIAWILMPSAPGYEEFDEY